MAIHEGLIEVQDDLLERFYLSNRLEDESQSLQQGALNPLSGRDFKPSSYAGLQLWSQRYSHGRSKVHYPPLPGNIAIAEDLEEDIEVLAPAPGPSTHQPVIHDVSSKAPISPADEEQFSPQPLGRLEALMLKENRTLTLLKVKIKEVSTHFDVPPKTRPATMVMYRMQGKKVIPDEVGDALVESSGPVKAVDREVQKLPTKRVVVKPQSLQARTWLINKWKRLYLEHRMDLSAMIKISLPRDARTSIRKDHIFVHCVQWSGQVLLMSCFGMLPEGQKMLNIFFHTDIL